MPRLNFDITFEQHRQLKTLASYSGMNMKDFVLSRVFTEATEAVFAPRTQITIPEDELSSAQSLLFKKAEIITLSGDKWKKFQAKAKKQKTA